MMNSDIQTSKAAGLFPIFKNISRILLGSFLIAASAYISIPLPYIPFTLQTLAVLTVGILYGKHLGVASVFSLIALGMMGFPVFHGANFWTVSLTIGYILGFIPAVYLAGVAKEYQTSGASGRALCTLFLADSCMFIGGIAVLSLFLGFSKAVTVGLFPFIFGDISKVLMAYLLMRRLCR